MTDIKGDQTIKPSTTHKGGSLKYSKLYGVSGKCYDVATKILRTPSPQAINNDRSLQQRKSLLCKVKYRPAIAMFEEPVSIRNSNCKQNKFKTEFFLTSQLKYVFRLEEKVSTRLGETIT